MGRPILSPLESHDRRRDFQRRLEALQQNQLQYPIPQLLWPVVAGGDLISSYLDVVTTQAAFHDMLRVDMERAARQALKCYVAYASDVGTTGEVRMVLSSAGGGTFTSAVTSIGSGANTYTLYRWRHTHRLWQDSPVTLTIQARRTGGAGYIYVRQPPNGLEQVDPRYATATGL